MNCINYEINFICAFSKRKEHCMFYNTLDKKIYYFAVIMEDFWDAKYSFSLFDQIAEDAAGQLLGDCACGGLGGGA